MRAGGFAGLHLKDDAGDFLLRDDRAAFIANELRFLGYDLAETPAAVGLDFRVRN